MKSCFNIIRGFIAAFIFILYWIILLISFIILPISIVFKDANSLNQSLDQIRFEEQIADLIIMNFDTSAQLEQGTEGIPEIDFAEIFNEETAGEIIALRREIISTVYTALENEEALTYEIDIGFLMDMYMDIFSQMTMSELENMVVCSEWVTPEESETMTEDCLPPYFAIANDIDIPDTVDVPTGFEVTDDMKIESMLDSEELMETQDIQNPVIEITEEDASDYNAILILMKAYIYVFIGLEIFLMLLFFLISPGTKAAMISLGIFNIITSIIGVVIWRAPAILMTYSRLSSSIPVEQLAAQEALTNMISSLLDIVAPKGLIMALWIGIISVLIIVLAIILPKKKKNEETPKEQPAGKDNSAK